MCMGWYFGIFIGILGFVLSLTLFILELRRHHIPLKFRVTDMDISSRGESWVLYLVRVSFVNPSSAGRTIFSLDVEPPEGYQVSLVRGQYDFSKGLVVYSPPSETTRVVPVSLPTDDTLPLPLDISSRQSVSKWIVLGVSPKPSLKQGSANVKCFLMALDVDGKELARTEAFLAEG